MVFYNAIGMEEWNVGVLECWEEGQNQPI